MEGSAKDLVLALEGLEREKNIKREDILKTIEDALVSALRKNLGKTAQISAKIDVESGSIKAFQTLNVVEVVTNPEMEIDVEGAKKYLKAPKAGDVVTITLEVEDFSRIAAQIAKQVLIQKVRGIERDNFYKEFKPREGEVITGSVRRFSDRDIIVDLGKVEAILPYCEQIKKENLDEIYKTKATGENISKRGLYSYRIVGSCVNYWHFVFGGTTAIYQSRGKIPCDRSKGDNEKNL